MKKKNFLFITLDNVRYDFLAHPKNNWIKTPNFREFAKESFQFNNHYVQIPFTPRSLFSMLYGVDLIKEPNKLAWLIRYFFCDTIPRFFKNKNYVTGGIVSALVLRRDMCPYVQGEFDIYDDYFETEIQESPQKKLMLNSIKSRSKKVTSLVAYALRKRGLKKRFPELPVQTGDVTTQKAISFIEKNKNRNWFLWVHYFDAHVTSPLRQYMIERYNKSFDDTHGYFAPPKYLHMYDRTNKIKEKYIYGNITTDSKFVDKTNKYAGCVSYLDKLFGDLIGYLKSNGLYDNTTIVLTSDHGTPLGKYGHGSKVTNVYDYTVKVPLFLKIDGKRKITDNLTEHSDLLSVIKMLYNKGDIIPEKLEKKETLYFESPAGFNSFEKASKMYGMRTNSFKFIIELRMDGGAIECKHYYFDLAKDPFENKNIFDQLDEAKKKELIKKLKRKFNKLDRHRDIISKFRSSTDDEKIKQRLKELGYF